MLHFRLQTNRVKLVEVISTFGKQSINSEILIAPRPLPKTIFKFYVAFVTVEENGHNHSLVTSIKNHKEISKSDFEKEIGDIEHYWQA